MTMMNHTAPLAAQASAWDPFACPVCHGPRYLDPMHGVGPLGSPEWVCLMCGRAEPLNAPDDPEPRLRHVARGLAR